MSTLPNNHANHEPTAQLAHIRLLNASPDTPAVDVFVNETRVAADLALKSFTEYTPAEPGVSYRNPPNAQHPDSLHTI